VEAHSFFLALLLILMAARVFAELTTRVLKAPRVLGELIAGVVLGPSVLGWVEPEPAIRLLAEIGIIMLLFEVGLHTDVRRLIDSGRKSLFVALSGFFLPLLFAFVLADSLFGLDPLVALFIGGTLTATSIGITIRVLGDLQRQYSLEGQVVLGAAVIDDILGVVLLVMLHEFSTGGGISVMQVGKVVLFISAFFVLAPVMAKLISLLIKRYERISDSPGLIPTSIVSLVLFFAWLAHAIGAPELLGGFAAGLALSRRFFLPFGIALHTDAKFSVHIDEQMRPIIQLFTPIFFVMVGLSLDLRQIDWGSVAIWIFALSMLLVAVIGKMAGPLVLKVSWPERLMIGTAMVPRGEVGLIFVEIGYISGIVPSDLHAALVIVIALTTLLPPLMMKWFYSRFGEQMVVGIPVDD